MIQNGRLEFLWMLNTNFKHRGIDSIHNGGIFTVFCDFKHGVSMKVQWIKVTVSVALAISHNFS